MEISASCARFDTTAMSSIIGSNASRLTTYTSSAWPPSPHPKQSAFQMFSDVDSFDLDTIFFSFVILDLLSALEDEKYRETRLLRFFA